MELNITLIVFLFPLKFIEKIHNYEITLDEAINNETELGILIKKLNNDYNPKIPKKVKEKKICNKNARCEKRYYWFFEKGIFPYKGNLFKTKEKESEEESGEESEKELKEERLKKFIKYIENESEGINYDLLKDYFNFVVPGALAKHYERQKIKRKTIS